MGPGQAGKAIAKRSRLIVMPRGAGASKTVAKLAPGGTEAETDRDRRNRDKTGGTEPSEMGVPLTGGWPWLGAKL